MTSTISVEFYTNSCEMQIYGTDAGEPCEKDFHIPISHNTIERKEQKATMGIFSKKLSEDECSTLVDKGEDLPSECLAFASVKAKLDSRSEAFAGMTPGAQRAVRNAQIQRRMSTRHGQGTQGKKSSWF